MGHIPCEKERLGICEQQKPRSASASAGYSGLSLSAGRITGYYRVYYCIVNDLIKLCRFVG